MLNHQGIFNRTNQHNMEHTAAAAVCLLLQIIALSQAEEFRCGFDDNSAFPEVVPFAADPHEAFQWYNGIIPFFFNANITQNDKNIILEGIEKIEDNTCFQFKEKNEEPNGHHLEIFVNSPSCLQPFTLVPRFSGFVTPKYFRKRDKILLVSEYQLSDSPDCDGGSITGILHELMHVLGVAHTQTRKDRDHFITVNWDNIQQNFIHQYEICYGCNDLGVGYDCASIMHYGHGTGAEVGPTMTAKNPQKCRLSRSGAAGDGRGASQSDWELLRKIANNFCSQGPSSDPGVCLTSGGAAADGSACVFPFKFRGVSHSKCTFVASDDGFAWCSTKTNRRGVHIGGNGYWGTCSQSCPKEEFEFQIVPEAQVDSNEDTQ